VADSRAASCFLAFPRRFGRPGFGFGRCPVSIFNFQDRGRHLVGGGWNEQTLPLQVANLMESLSPGQGPGDDRMEPFDPFTQAAAAAETGACITVGFTPEAST
jgi:hypothetical protein